jgi:hypothetical protein
MTREDIRKLVEAWASAVAAYDVDALGRLVAPPLREIVVGRTRAVHAAFRDVEVVPVQVVIDVDVDGEGASNVIAWRWRLTGTHVAAVGGIAPSGERRSIDGVNFQRVRDGVVVEHWTTVNLADLARERGS